MKEIRHYTNEGTVKLSSHFSVDRCVTISDNEQNADFDRQTETSWWGIRQFQSGRPFPLAPREGIQRLEKPEEPTALDRHFTGDVAEAGYEISARKSLTSITSKPNYP